MKRQKEKWKCCSVESEKAGRSERHHVTKEGVEGGGRVKKTRVEKVRKEAEVKEEGERRNRKETIGTSEVILKTNDCRILPVARLICRS